LRPLRRRPKTLSDDPLLFRPDGPGNGAPISTGIEGGGDDRARRRAAGHSGRWIATTEAGQCRPLREVEDDADLDRSVLDMADTIAARLSVRPKTRDRLTVIGSGQLVSRPYRFGSDDIDLDRTLEALTEHPVPEDTDIVVRERMRSQRAIVLIADVSGSMRGEKVRVAAATVGALAGALNDDELAVVAFWKDAALVTPLNHPEPPSVILERLLRIPAKGLTNVHFALTVALRELGHSRARRRRAILLSDTVHNAGPDPRLIADRFERLDVLLQTDDEHDTQLGTDLARIGHGTTMPIHNHRQVPSALNQLLTD
jgi:Mg-chelatase subunit ChlD